MGRMSNERGLFHVKQLTCNQCGRIESEPFDVDDLCYCGGRFRKGVSMQKKQEYFCPYCGINGTVLIEEHADVSTVVNQLDADHKKNAPGCPSPESGLRVRTEASAEKDRGAIVTAEYLTFVKIEQRPRTSVWRVDDRDGKELGRIFFYSRWRQYSYEATSPAIYSAGCLADLMRFIESSERTRRGGKQSSFQKSMTQEKTW